MSRYRKFKIISILMLSLTIFTGCKLQQEEVTNIPSTIEYVEGEGYDEYVAMYADSNDTIISHKKTVSSAPAEKLSTQEKQIAQENQVTQETPVVEEHSSTESVKEEPTEANRMADEQKSATLAKEYRNVKGYDNLGVRTTLDGNRYTADGSSIKLNGKTIVNLSTKVSKDYPSDMSHMLFISDLASRVEGGDVALYAVGLTFKKRTVNYNDTKEYYNSMVNVGSPYTVVFKHLVNSNKTYMLYKQKHYGIFTAQHYDTQFNEAKAKQPDDSVYNGDGVLIDFITPSILPHMTISRDGKFLCIVNGVTSEDEKFHMNEYINILKLSTNHLNPTAIQVPFYMRHYEDFFKQYGYHHVDTHMFYPKEQDDGTVAIASIGQPDSKIATLFTVDMNIMNTVKGYWRNRDEVMSLVED